MFRGRAQRLHFIGIGGIGMSGIAEVLLNLGYDIRGSDLSDSLVTRRLAGMGATIFRGHDPENIADADVVVTSTAVSSDNPEVVQARRHGVPVIRRAEMLAELMRLKYGIAIAGTHGKTTTTSLAGEVLTAGGVDPTMVVGGRLKSLSSNARLGEGEYLVAEADESDGSFLRLMPTIAVITGIDLEHLDHWRGGIDEIVQAFVDFAQKTPFYGCVVACLDHPRVQAALPRIDRRLLTYGLSVQADYSASNITAAADSMNFMVSRRGESLGEVRLNMIGRHNVQNALAAIAVADEVGVDFAIIAAALARFEGIGRRFEEKGRARGVVVVDDYAHHPEELKATLQAARQCCGRRVVAAFQPHRHSRTRDLFGEFTTSFNAADVLFVGDIYAAGEEPIDGVSAAGLAEAVAKCGHGRAEYVGDVDAMAAVLEAEVQPGDLVITLGAGNIYRAGEQLLTNLQADEEAS